ncbi:MAG: SEC-C domain-containing protein [Actinobacteria bacterium]|nr:SEC-C domain-containing protein [Actinomycetota bacterium]
MPGRRLSPDPRNAPCPCGSGKKHKLPIFFGDLGFPADDLVISS